MGAAKPRGRRFVMHGKRGDWGKLVLISCLPPYSVLAQGWESSYQAMGILPAVEPFLNIMGACHTSVSGRGNIEQKY